MTIAVFNSDELHILNKIWEDLSERSDHMGVSKQTFLKYIPVNGLLGERLFAQFDKNDTGHISKENFIGGLTILCLGTITEQSKFLFELFDVNGTGEISKQNLVSILNYIPPDIFCGCNMKRRSMSGEFTDDFLSYTNLCHCEGAFVHHSEYINKDDFCCWVKRTPALLGYIKSIIPCTAEDDIIDINNKFPLWKEGAKTNFMFKRFCLLKGNCLYSYYNKTDTRPKRVIFLSGSIVEKLNNSEENSLMQSKGFYGFEILQQYDEEDPFHTHHHDHEKRIFYCNSEETRDSLIHKLQHMAHIVPFEEDYILGKKIGVGAFSEVFECTNKKTLNKFAVKLISKTIYEKVSRVQLNNEIAILKLTNHPNIIHLEDTYEDKENIYIVIELIEDGDFCNFVNGQQCFTTERLRPIMKQLFDALAYLHEFGIVHCDLKPENILIRKHPESIVKLTDFGLSRMILENQRLDVACGTLQYVPPEMLTLKGYGMESDMWGAGVIMFLLANGRLPYDDDKPDKILEQIQLNELKFKSSVDAEAKDIITKLLEKNPKKRITAKDALLHPFIANHAERRLVCSSSTETLVPLI